MSNLTGSTSSMLGANMAQMRISQYPSQNTQSLSPQKRTSMGVARENGSEFNSKKGSILGVTSTGKGRTSGSVVAG